MPDILPGADRAKTFNQEIRTIVFCGCLRVCGRPRCIIGGMTTSKLKSGEVRQNPIFPSREFRKNRPMSDKPSDLSYRALWPALCLLLIAIRPVGMSAGNFRYGLLGAWPLPAGAVLAT